MISRRELFKLLAVAPFGCALLPVAKRSGVYSFQLKTRNGQKQLFIDGVQANVDENGNVAHDVLHLRLKSDESGTWLTQQDDLSLEIK